MQMQNLVEQPSNKFMMSSSGKSNSSTNTVQFDENPIQIKVTDEIEELPYEEEQYEKMYDIIHELEYKVEHNKLNDDELENTLFKILKLKCQAGAFYNKQQHRTCTAIRKEMQEVMGEFSVKYCFLVFLGCEYSGNIHVIPTIINKERYFKISFETYTFVVYEIKREATLDYEPVLNQRGSLVSIDLNISKENIPAYNSNNNNNDITIESRSKAISFMSNSDQSQKGLNNISSISNLKGTNSRQSFSKLPLQQSKTKRQSIVVSSMSRSDQRKNTSYLQQQIIKDEMRIQKAKQAQEKYQSTLVQQEIPTKNKLLKIAKNYVDYMGKPSFKKPFTTQDYAVAIQKAFHAKNIQPKLIVVKQAPQGDYFWDYECENDVTLHTWDLLKDNDKCVAVIV